MDKKMKALVLCSGGLDSVVTANYVKKKLGFKDIVVLFFNYGQKSLNVERKFSKRCARDVEGKFVEISVKELGKMSMSLINKKGKANRVERKELKDTNKESDYWYVPCRNLVFLSYALALAESEYVRIKKKRNIFVGFKCEGKESFPDTTKEFINSINGLSKISSEGFNVVAPMIEKDKDEIILLGKKMGVDFRHTHSCYVGNKEHCGTCLSCRLRQEAFYWANVQDPTKYKEKTEDFRLAIKP